jgi:hypothetical protein
MPMLKTRSEWLPPSRSRKWPWRHCEGQEGGEPSSARGRKKAAHLADEAEAAEALLAEATEALLAEAIEAEA